MSSAAMRLKIKIDIQKPCTPDAFHGFVAIRHALRGSCPTDELQIVDLVTENHVEAGRR